MFIHSGFDHMAQDADDTFRARAYDLFVSYKRGEDDARAVLVAALARIMHQGDGVDHGGRWRAASFRPA